MAASADSTVMRMVPDAPLTQAHRVFKQLGISHIFVVGPQSPDTQDCLLGLLTKKSFLKHLKNGIVGHKRDRSPNSSDRGETVHRASGLSVLGTAMAASPAALENENS